MFHVRAASAARNREGARGRGARSAVSRERSVVGLFSPISGEVVWNCLVIKVGESSILKLEVCIGKKYRKIFYF